MNFHFSQGSKNFPDGHSVKFKELELTVNRSARLTIRIYPSNTFLTYNNDYKNFTKVLYKEPHSVAQRNMGKWLETTFEKMKLRVGGEEFQSVMAMYDQLVKSPLN